MIRKCERCSSPMDLFACAPSLGGLPELRTYKCSCCGDVETDAGVISALQPGAQSELHDVRAS
jgi:hypothetical protein